MLKAAIRNMSSSIIKERLLLHSTQTTHPQTSIPIFLYGTAWKKDETANLVYQALSSGFTGIDTACQPKHYRENLVGEGLRKALQEGKVKRGNIYLQTKYTSVKGQDPNNIPYDPSLSITEQVHSSIKTSLRNLRILDAPETEDDTSDYIDTLVLHSPLPTMEETMEAWTACEQYVPNRLRNLGISNCPLSVLKELYNSANIKPTVVQNRFYANTKFDIPLRQFCSENSIVYQSFWTLSANPRLVRSAEVDLLSKQADISPEAALYCLVLGLGNTVILDGTTQETHMVADLAAPTAVDKFASEHPDQWEDILKRFKTLIGQPT